jgi:hypothetical protein
MARAIAMARVDPAELPVMITLVGSPPKCEMDWVIHWCAKIMSSNAAGN